MSSKDVASREPNVDLMESLFVNNEKLNQLEAYLNRFNPIKVMKMERMEIRHSAILAWLLDPSETHGSYARIWVMAVFERWRILAGE